MRALARINPKCSALSLKPRQTSSVSYENKCEYWDRRSTLRHSALNHSTLICNYQVQWLILHEFQENFEEEIWE